MRTTLAAVLSLSLLAGCGSDDSPPPPVFGGFEPIEQAALIFAPATCDIPFLGPTAVAGVGIAFTDYAGACDVLAQTQFCGTRGSSSTVLAVAISGLVGGTTTVFAGPGTYPYLARPRARSWRARRTRARSTRPASPFRSERISTRPAAASSSRR